MADDKTERGSPDNKRLNKSEPYEVAYAKAKRAKAAAAKSAKTSAKKATTRSGASPVRTKPRTPTTRGTPKPPQAEKTTKNTAPRTMKKADAVDLLTDDHLQVDALFKQYEKLAKKQAPARQRKTLVQTIGDMLWAHTAIEEEIFYPAARRAGIDANMLDEADIEHASAKGLIAQIEAGNADADHYDAKVKVLGEYITHYVVEEHTEIFPKCRRTSMDLVALRGKMEARKMALLPDVGDKSPSMLTKLGETPFSK